jgi:hypothetical protein
MIHLPHGLQFSVYCLPFKGRLITILALDYGCFDHRL